jgi:hypothetical protein
MGDEVGNKLVSEVHRRMKERRDRAVSEVKEVFKEQVRLFAAALKNK